MIEEKDTVNFEEIISFWIYYNHYVHDIIQVIISPNVKAENQNTCSN